MSLTQLCVSRKWSKSAVSRNCSSWLAVNWSARHLLTLDQLTFWIWVVIIVLLLLLSLSLIALVSYCVFYRNLLFMYSATQPQGWNKLSVTLSVSVNLLQLTYHKNLFVISNQQDDWRFTGAILCVISKSVILILFSSCLYFSVILRWGGALLQN